MRINKKSGAIVRGKKGVTAVLAAILIVMLLGFAALAIDIGYGMVTKNELQNIADAAALAAARQLGTIYQGMTYEEQLEYVVGSSDETLIKNAAIEVASQNKAGGMNNIVIRAEDILIGKWSPWSETDEQPNAVRVTARRDSLENGQITTFFAKIFGVSGRDVTAMATAAMTGQSTVDPGELELPVGISRQVFDEDRCGDYITFSPPEVSCAGWTSWEYTPTSDEMLREILKENPDYPSPDVLAYDTFFNFTGGKLSQQTFDALLTLFRIKGYDVFIDADGETQPILDADGNQIQAPVPLCENTSYVAGESNCSVPCPPGYDPATRLKYPDGTPRNLHEWPTTVPVYENEDGTADCDNPTKERRIVGFARITMDDVCDAPDKIIRGVVECSYVEPSDNRGGGGPYGVLGPIPGLVE